MTDTDEENQVIEIDGKTYLLPMEVLDKNHIHRKKKKWVSMWFYKNRKKTRVYKTETKDDLIITSKLEYQKGIFYKMSQLSAEDNCFDYFYKLKEGVPKNIVKKNQRYKVKKYNNKAWRNIPHKAPEIKDGKFIVYFN
tara:strand:+ start:380 stop:793 length:414 start_codon:yes stop_codon:yes gene_type:complete